MRGEHAKILRSIGTCFRRMLILEDAQQIADGIIQGYIGPPVWYLTAAAYASANSAPQE